MDYKPGDIYLGIKGQEVEVPAGNRNVTPLAQEIKTTNRTADGTLITYITRKYTDYQIDYVDDIPTDDHNIIKSLYDLNQNLNMIYCDENGTVITQPVQMTWTPGQRILYDSGYWWSGVQFVLEAV